MLVLLLGCGDDVTFHRVPPDPDATAPRIELDPATLTFDPLTVAATAELPITVSNVGATTLTVSGLTLSGSTAFSLVETELAATLAPEASATFHVRFTPVNPEDVGTLSVSSDDPAEPVATAVLSGAAIVPELRAWPDPLDFGAVPTDCTLTLPLYVENTGTADLVIETVAADDTSFAIDRAALPLTLAPGEQHTFDTSFTPAESAPYAATVYLTSNDLTGFTTVAADGSGGGDGSVTDRFTQGDQVFEATDILLYVDGSGSMSDDQANLTTNFGEFVEALGEAELDWRLIVVTADDGCHNEDIFTVDNINTLDLLDAVRGPVGSWTEAGLWLTRTALTEADGCNAGWLRSEARTTMILVSDEAEQSPGRTADIVDDILALAPTATIHSIAGDLPDGCSTADAGTGYAEASALTGGVFLSICDADWGAYFRTIAERTGSDQTDTFPLSAWPAPATIEVEVDGAAASGWTYDDEGNAVVFLEGSLPPPSASVVVSYALDAECLP